MKNYTRILLLISPIIVALFCNFPAEPVRPFKPYGGMKIIPAGTFAMGSTDTVIDTGAQPVHQVTVSSFYMDSTEVTQMEYQDLTGYNPVTSAPYLTTKVTAPFDYFPVEYVTWYDAVLFANAKSKRYHYDTVYTYSKAITTTFVSSSNQITGIRCDSLVNVSCDFSKKGYRLPTEAEWEYACRANTTTVDYWGSDSINDTVSKYCWYFINSSDRLNIVAFKRPNAFRLFDMIGNVWEWCNDYYEKGYSADTVTDPKGPVSGNLVVRRGGSYTGDNYDGSLARSATRSYNPPSKYSGGCGFRLVFPN